MSHAYQTVQWNKQKKRYDLFLSIGILVYLTLFIGGGALLYDHITIETLLIRSTSTASFILLHFILMIGPLCRLNTNWLPLLYNRRHMGVSMFLLGLIHSVLVTIQYHSLGVINPILNIFIGNTNYGSLSQFPFEVLGVFALFILFIMAATSHDFWLANLTPPIWKSLHMLVYIAYGLLCAHVILGFLQSDTHPLLAGLMGMGFLLICGLHIKTGFKEAALDTPLSSEKNDWIKVCHTSDIQESRAKIVTISNERVAIFKYKDSISAVSNVCQHQNGPLGEGRIIDGCITCPWHGFQYLPHNGQSPAPFTEKVPTFNVKVIDGYVHVHPKPNVAGTEVTPAPCKGTS